MALPLDGVMVIDPLELFGDYHLTPTRGRIKTVNWSLKGAEIPIFQLAKLVPVGVWWNALVSEIGVINDLQKKRKQISVT
jgi:hypothetical protein